MRIRRFQVWMIGAVLLEMALPGVVHGQANSWTNSANGAHKWEDGTKWSLGVPPATGHFAILITNGVSAVPRSRFVVIDETTAGSFPGTMTISNLTLGVAPSNISFNTLILTNTTPTGLHVLNTFSIIKNGTVRLLDSASLVVDAVFDVNGTASMEGGTGTLNGNTYVGTTASGQLIIRNGTVNAGTLALGSQGTLTATGGVLTVAKLVATDVGSIIRFPRGVLTLHGADIANGQPLEIGGSDDTAVLNLTAGTNRFANGFTLGTLAASTGIVYLTGGSLVTTNPLSANIIGSGGIGQMTMSNGTWLSSAHTSVGQGGALTIAGGTMSSVGEADLQIGSATVWLTGGKLGGGSVVMDSADIAQLVLSNGQYTAVETYLGLSPGSRAELIVAGGSHYWGDNMIVGHSNCLAEASVTLNAGRMLVTKPTRAPIHSIPAQRPSASPPSQPPAMMC